MSRKVDRTGLVSGYLTAIERDKEDSTKWLCRCVCGNIKSVDGSKLLRGNPKSCGCKTNEMKGRPNTSAAKVEPVLPLHSLYTIWR